MISIAFMLFGALAAPPPGELVWWAPDAPASGLAIRGNHVQRGLGPGRSEWWPMDGDPPRLLPSTTRCPSRGQTFDPPVGTLPGKALPWGPISALAESENGFCTLAATVAGPLLLYRRDRLLMVLPRNQPALRVTVGPQCEMGAAADDEDIDIFSLDPGKVVDPVRIPVGDPPSGLALTRDAVIAIADDGAVDVYRHDGQKRASIEPGAPIGCAAASAGVFVGETVDARTRAYAVTDGSLKWGRPAVDDELGEEWRAEPPRKVAALAVDPTGRWIAAIIDGEVRLWAPAEKPPINLPEIDDALDIVFAPDGRRLAIRRVSEIDVWSVKGVPKRQRIVDVEDPPSKTWGPTMGWIGQGTLVALTEEALIVLDGRDEPRHRVESGRAVVMADRGLDVLTATGVQPFTRRGRSGPLVPGPARRHPGPSPTLATGARRACDGHPILNHPDGRWRRWGTDIRGELILCHPNADTGLSLLADEVSSHTIERGGGPPMRFEERLPLLGDIDVLALDPMGRVTALLDGTTIVRWRPGGGTDRATWLVVGREDVIAVGGRLWGATSALRSLSWWAGETVTSATEAPRWAPGAYSEAVSGLEVRR